MKLYLVDIFDDTQKPAQIYADKPNIETMVSHGLSLCVNHGYNFLDVVKGEYVNPIPEWFV